tara:strand:+ start:270 stop:884 length:615 start_codon:yes stop_codon:yes gene_type:complete
MIRSDAKIFLEMVALVLMTTISIACQSSQDSPRQNEQYLSTPVAVHNIETFGSKKPQGNWIWFERAHKGYNMILLEVADDKVRLDKTRVAVYGNEAFVGREIFFGLFDKTQGAFVTNRNNCLPSQSNLLVLTRQDGHVHLNGSVGKHVMGNNPEGRLSRRSQMTPKDFLKLIRLVDRKLEDRTNGCFKSDFLKFQGDIETVIIQ